MRRMVVCAVMVGVLTAGRADAQQRPLLTEDPETIGSGLVLLEAGIDQQRGIFYPVSGLTGNLLRLPTLGLSFGISSIAEIQIDGGIYNRLTVTGRETAPLSAILNFTGDHTTSLEDLVIGTKVRVLSETSGRPALGFRFATRLPNTSNESGLGLDTSDFYVSMLVGKTVQSIRVVGNVGVGILGDPIRGDNQHDVLIYGVSLARALRQGLEVVGEVNGRLDVRAGEAPVGTEPRGAMRLGGRFTSGTVRIDAGLILGMTSRDPSVGFTTGLTWVFQGFRIP